MQALTGEWGLGQGFHSREEENGGVHGTFWRKVPQICRRDVQGEERGLEDDVSVFDSGWVLVLLSQDGRGRFGGRGQDQELDFERVESEV